MRHLNSGSKLGKQPDHRRAVLRSLVTNLLEHGRITTTLTRAKAARPVAEKMITLGKRDTLQSRRQAASYIMLPAVTQKLFSEIAPKFSDRAGGYTRIIHAGNRVGDNAKVAILELIGYEFKLKEKKEKPKKRCLLRFPLHLPLADSGTTPTARRRRRKRQWNRAGNRKLKPCGWRRRPGEFHPGRNIPRRSRVPSGPRSSASLCGRRARHDRATGKTQNIP